MKLVPLAFVVLAGCASSNEQAAGVSTAPQSVPHAQVPDDAAVPDLEPTPDAAAPAVPPAPKAAGRLHPVTGMAMGKRKLDPKVLIARIETQPGALDACSALASAEPNAPDGTWNVRLTLAKRKAELAVESAVAADFEKCLVTAAQSWDLASLGDGEAMLLLGLAR